MDQSPRDFDTVRTPDRPMVFTGRELRYGAWVAWLTFVALLLLTLTLTAVISDLVIRPQPGWGSATRFLVVALPVAAVFGGAVSALVALTLLPVVAALARRLERVIDRRVHVALYAVFGAVLGLAACTVSRLASDMPPGSIGGDGAVFAVAAGICAASVVFGWWRAVRRAFRRPDRLMRASSRSAAPAD